MPTARRTRLGTESLETRDVPAPLTGLGSARSTLLVRGPVGPIIRSPGTPAVFVNPFAINTDLRDGTLYISGTAGNDTARVTSNDSANTVQVDTTRADGLTESKTFAKPDVRRIEFAGGAGNDTFTNDTAIPATAYGGAGDDVLTGGPAGDFLYGEAGDDRVDGRGGFDVVDGGADNDRVYGGTGVDTVAGGTGNDVLVGDPQAFAWDLVDGGGDYDVALVNQGMLLKGPGPERRGVEHTVQLRTSPVNGAFAAAPNYQSVGKYSGAVRGKQDGWTEAEGQAVAESLYRLAKVFPVQRLLDFRGLPQTLFRVGAAPGDATWAELGRFTRNSGVAAANDIPARTSAVADAAFGSAAALDRALLSVLMVQVWRFSPAIGGADIWALDAYAKTRLPRPGHAVDFMLMGWVETANQYYRCATGQEAWPSFDSADARRFFNLLYVVGNV